MKKEYPVQFSRFSETDLVEILDYYYVLNHDYAIRIIDSIEKRVAELKTLPERGRIVHELEKQNIFDYRELIEDNYRIIYSIQDNTVIIQAVIDSRRNLDEFLIKKLYLSYKL